jgi:hypothetical protein
VQVIFYFIDVLYTSAPIFVTLIVAIFNLLKSTVYMMHQQVEHSRSVHSATLDVFCIYRRTSSDLCHLHHKLIVFYNRDGKRLLRDTKWVF